MTQLTDREVEVEGADVLERARQSVLAEGVGLSEADVLAVLRLPDDRIPDLLELAA